MSNGLASLLLILHEHYESSHTFEPASEETIDNLPPSMSSPFPAHPRSISTSWPELCSPLKRDRTRPRNRRNYQTRFLVDSSFADLGLRDIQSEIDYSLVQFHAPEHWMPASAIIDANCKTTLAQRSSLLLLPDPAPHHPGPTGRQTAMSIEVRPVPPFSSTKIQNAHNTMRLLRLASGLRHRWLRF